MAHAAPDEPEHGADNTKPQQNGDLSDGRNLAIKKSDKEKDKATGDNFRLDGGERVKISGVTCKSDGSGSYGKWRLHEGLPDKEEGHQAAPAAGPVGFSQKNISATGFGHSGAEFGPDEAIESGEERAREPGDERLRSAHGFDDQ